MTRFVVMCAAPLFIWACSGDELNKPELERALSSAQSKQLSQEGPTLAVPYSDLGDHVAEVSLNFFVRTAAGFRHRVAIDRRVFRGVNGAFRILDDRSWTDPDASPRGADDGRELLFTGQRFMSRRKWGPWKDRPFWRGEHREALKQAYDVLPTVLSMFNGHLSRVPGNTETIMLKEARWESFSLNTTPVVSDKPIGKTSAKTNDRFDETRLDQWFQSTHRPEVVTGRLARRIDNGEIVRAEITIQGRATVQREDAEFELSASFNLMPVGSDLDFSAPKKVLPAERKRTWTMIRDVLGDSLRSVYRRRAGDSPAK